VEDKWKQLIEVNEALRDSFLCVPPYQCVNFNFIKELHGLLDSSDKMIPLITQRIHNPSQRAYQMEYRFKKCDIFHPYIAVLEYAFYDMLNGNWICAYLSLLPVVEAVLRKWADVAPKLTFGRMKMFAPQLSLYMHEKELYKDFREVWSNSHIEYLQYVLTILYESFNEYEEQNFGTIFNRNLTLHKLEGVVNMREGLQNVTRILLVLDVIAELYLMQDFKAYYQIIFDADPENNDDYQLRWALYKKWSSFAIGRNDILLIPNALLKNEGELNKKELTRTIEQESEILLQIERNRFKNKPEL
jgi:hypothetical protein